MCVGVCECGCVWVCVWVWVGVGGCVWVWVCKDYHNPSLMFRLVKHGLEYFLCQRCLFNAFLKY